MLSSQKVGDKGPLEEVTGTKFLIAQMSKKQGNATFSFVTNWLAQCSHELSRAMQQQGRTTVVFSQLLTNQLLDESD
eukprot:906395-Karenia_brevis.AAC.1